MEEKGGSYAAGTMTRQETSKRERGLDGELLLCCREERALSRQYLLRVQKV